MKKELTIVALLAMSVFSFAQTDSLFVFNKGTVVCQENLDQIDRIKFSNDQSQLEIWNGKGERVRRIALQQIDSITSYASAPAKAPLAKHLIVIGIDGWGSYSYEKAEIPNIKRLAARGSYTLRKRSVLPSSSAANWASMFMGASPEIHGYTQALSKVPEIPSRVISSGGIFPTLFRLNREAHPSVEMGAVYEWDGIKYLVDEQALDHSELATDNYIKYPELICTKTITYLTEKKPDVAFIQMDYLDHVGHKQGHDTPEYYAKLSQVDGYIGRILTALEEAGMMDESIVIVTADHGGKGRTHGAATMEEMETPFIIAGNGIKKGYCFDNISMMQYDCASVMVEILKLNQPHEWIGRPIMSIFTEK